MDIQNHYEIGNITPEFLSMIKLPDKNGKKLNYLIVVPPSGMGEDTSYSFPFGIAMVCSSLKASGRPVFVLNLNYKIDHGKWLNHMIKANDIHVVLTGGFCGAFNYIRYIIDTAKKIKPDIITVVGGAICDVVRDSSV